VIAWNGMCVSAWRPRNSGSREPPTRRTPFINQSCFPVEVIFISARSPAGTAETAFKKVCFAEEAEREYIESHCENH
jgi:hypothetical protein